ncbi:MAG: site-2 protease family protein [Acidilobaceae archaeon]|nr:site-2 protease family protein [Acidilobaceae archaeon]MDW7974649.1 site-2 protease family protein [Sulfolobales archaeon]
MVESLLLFLAAMAIAWAAIWLTLRGKRDNVQVYPFLLIWRSGISQEAYPPGRKAFILNLIGWPSIALIFILQVLFYFVAINMFVSRYLSPQLPSVTEGFVPFLPGVTVPLDINLVVILIAIGLAVVVHELGHALMARAVGVKVRDAGFVLLAFIPGAFVEPDEEELKRSSLASRAKIYSAGVAANVLLALLAAPLILLASSYLAGGVLVSEVISGSPAELGGLKAGAVVVEVNEKEVKTLEDFMRALELGGARDPSREVTLVLRVREGGEVKEVKVVKPRGEERIGVRISQFYEGGFYTLLALTILNALVTINIALALVNAAPIFLPTPAGALVTDGAHLLGDLVGKVAGERAKLLISSTVGIATLLLVISLITITPIRFLP